MRALRTPRHKTPEGAVYTRPPKKRPEDLTLDDLCHECRKEDPKTHSCQRKALIRAAAEGIRAGEDGVRQVTIAALERKGLVHERTSKKGRTSWRATETGRFIVADDRPWFMHRVSYLGTGLGGDPDGSGYTRNPAHALRDEQPEVMRDAA